jgi:hypothetical protein
MSVLVSSQHSSAERITARRAGVAALVAGGWMLALAAAPPAADAALCAPPGPWLSTDVVRADRAGGSSEVTELLRGGGYRVTRCGAGGALRVSQTLTPIADPDGGVVLVPTERDEPGVHSSALYGNPSDRAWAAAFRASRRALRASVIAPTPGATSRGRASAGSGAARESSVADPAAATIAGDACTNGQYNTWQSAWTGRSYNYYINRTRFAYNDAIIASIVAGHRAWDTTYNDCGFGDITNLVSYHIGSTAATAHTMADGISVVDKGDLIGMDCAGALACTWLFNNASGASSETDTRFNETMPWSTVGAGGAYDYQSVATHESGHAIGLDHASASSALTMFPTLPTGTTHARTLARGDILGMRARYP